MTEPPPLLHVAPPSRRGRVVVLTPTSSAVYARRLLTPVRLPRLADAILGGTRYDDHTLSSQMLARRETLVEVPGMAYPSTTGDLPPETRRVLQLAAAGLGIGAITERLRCDRDAVRRCLADAIRALSARSVPDAVEVALRRGLIRASG